jgi:hypothetical protein
VSAERRPTIVRRGSGRIRRPVTASDFSFTEQSPDEHGFAHIFRDDITPILRRHEENRRVMRNKALLRIGALVLIGAGAGAGGFALDWGGPGFILPVLCAFAAIAVYAYYQSAWRAALSAEVMPILCNFLGNMEYGGPTLSANEFEDLGVVPSHTSASLEDTVTGAHNGLGYTLTEAKLTYRTRSSKGRSSTRTVFKGLMMRIELAEAVPEITFARDRGELVNRISETLSSTRRGREKIDTGDGAFQQYYEVYSADPAAARRFITPRLTAGLLEIAQAETGRERYVAAATRGRGFYLAIPRTDDFLGMGSFLRPLTVAEDDFHNCLADLALPRRVIEALGGG